MLRPGVFIVITGITKARKVAESATLEQSLVSLIHDFLADLRNADRSPHTIRAYESDLLRYCRFCDDVRSVVLVETPRTFFASRSDRAPATRARTQAALASFFAWAYRGGQIAADKVARSAVLARNVPCARWRGSGQ